MIKKCLIPLLSMTLAFTSVGNGGAESLDSPVKVMVNGHSVDFPDAKPMINANDWTIVPVRFVTEELGYQLSWNEAKRTVKLSKGKEQLYLKIGQYESKIVDSRTYVPLRYVAEAFGAEVQWNGKNRTASIWTEDILSEPTAPDEEPDQQQVPSDPPGTVQREGWESKAKDVIRLAEKYYGVEYEYGAKAGRTDVFDCSSFTQYVFWKNGIKLKRASRPQFLNDGNQVLSRDELRPGDLVFFSTAGTAKKYSTEDYRRNGHVGIVKEIKENGEIIFIHTYEKGIGVTDSKMQANRKKGWWNRHFLYGKRVIADDGTEAQDAVIQKDDIKMYIK